MDFSLHSSGLDDLSPPTYRSPGLHVSTLIDRLCIRLGHYEHTAGGISDRNRELGQALEHAIVARFTRANPGEIFLHNPEILCDGISLTPDIVWLSRMSDIEAKLTWMSPTNDPTTVKMWKYLTQGKAYLYALRKVMLGEASMREACACAEEVKWDDHPEIWNQRMQTLPHDAYRSLYLTVGFVNDFRPPAEQLPCWKVDFWPEELEMNWCMLMEEKAKVISEQLEQAKDNIRESAAHIMGGQ
jgi:hypothetical protein